MALGNPVDCGLFMLKRAETDSKLGAFSFSSNLMGMGVGEGENEIRSSGFKRGFKTSLPAFRIVL